MFSVCLRLIYFAGPLIKYNIKSTGGLDDGGGEKIDMREDHCYRSNYDPSRQHTDNNNARVDFLLMYFSFFFLLLGIKFIVRERGEGSSEKTTFYLANNNSFRRRYRWVYYLVCNMPIYKYNKYIDSIVHFLLASQERCSIRRRV